MKKCTVCDKEGRIIKGLCERHYMQQRLYGEVMDRTRFDANEIIYHDDFAEIILYGKGNVEIARTQVDLDDVDKIKDYKWSLTKWGYVRCLKLNTFLHRFIKNPQNDMVIDHINRNPLDNRKINLRICTQRENILNKSFEGCGIKQRGKRFQARIKVKGKEITLGTFATYEEALSKRKEAEKELWMLYNYY